MSPVVGEGFGPPFFFCQFPRTFALVFSYQGTLMRNFKRHVMRNQQSTCPELY